MLRGYFRLSCLPVSCFPVLLSLVLLSLKSSHSVPRTVLEIAPTPIPGPGLPGCACNKTRPRFVVKRFVVKRFVVEICGQTEICGQRFVVTIWTTNLRCSHSQCSSLFFSSTNQALGERRATNTSECLRRRYSNVHESPARTKCLTQGKRHTRRTCHTLRLAPNNTIQ